MVKRRYELAMMWRWKESRRFVQRSFREYIALPRVTTTRGLASGSLRWDPPGTRVGWLPLRFIGVRYRRSGSAKTIERRVSRFQGSRWQVPRSGFWPAGLPL